jgi:gliding motility-associated-like protein
VFTAAITVFPLPVADFSPNPAVVRKSDDPTWTVLFTDESQGASSISWDFGDPQSGASNTSGFSPVTHSYSSENQYQVVLIATTDHGCLDTAIRTVTIIDDILQFANVFTPNGDGVNDLFEIKNIEKYPESELQIFNRWGEVIYRYVGYKNDWDGRGIPDGTYYYLLSYTFKGERKEYKGTVSVIR